MIYQFKAEFLFITDKDNDDDNDDGYDDDDVDEDNNDDKLSSTHIW